MFENTSWVSVVGPIIFGSGLGYLMASMFVVEELDPNAYKSVRYIGKLRPTWQGLSMFIAVALSTAILQVFPQSSTPFWSYAMGVGIGVFIREIKRAATQE